MANFWQELQTQRWDDHRFYHQSRINQSLHLLSALSFLASYVVVWRSPAAAALLGWLVSMVSRQSGHFFFEPKGYDTVNRATHQYKEDVKVGYNLHRKVWLMAIWALSPAILYFSPTCFGLLKAPASAMDVADHVGILWLVVAVGALAFRMVQLFFIRGVAAGVVWVLKILTDPFHDVLLYWRAPLALLRGELIDPMDDVLEAEKALHQA